MSSLHAYASHRKTSFIFWPFLVIIIILASEIAVICSLNFSPINGLLISAQSSRPFLIAVPVAGLLVGLPGWQRYVMRARSATVKRGILVGSFCSIGAHPIMWISIWIWLFLKSVFLYQLDPNAFSSLIGFMIVMVISLLYTGWITTIVDSLAGALLIYLQSALTQEVETSKKNVL